LTDGGNAWTGDPAEIANLSDPPIIEGLLREREVATVVGAAKTAKTWFSLALALSVASGDPFLGMTTHRRKLLYLDYELKEGTFRKRMSLLAPDRPEGFFFQCLRGKPRLPTVEEIGDLVKAEGFGLVVIDSLYRTGWLTEENNNDSTGRELTKLQTFTAAVGCTLILVDHTAKGGGNERTAVDAARGASAKGGFYDALLVLRPTDKGPDPEGNYCILDPVLRDWPKLPQLPLVSFTWTATSCEVALAGEVDRGESDATSTRILEVIAGAEMGIGKSLLNRAATAGVRPCHPGRPCYGFRVADSSPLCPFQPGRRVFCWGRSGSLVRRWRALGAARPSGGLVAVFVHKGADVGRGKPDIPPELDGGELALFDQFLNRPAGYPKGGGGGIGFQ